MFLKDQAPKPGFFWNFSEPEEACRDNVVTAQATYNRNGAVSKTMSIYQHKL